MTDETPDTPVEAPAKPQEAADEALGDAGKKALVAERDARKKAEKQASEYKAQLDQIEQANLSELEKAQRRVAEVEALVQAREAEAKRLTIAANHGITGEYLELVTGADEAEMEARAVKVAALIQKTPRGPIIPGQGLTPDAPAGTPADQFAALIEERLI